MNEKQRKYLQDLIKHDLSQYEVLKDDLDVTYEEIHSSLVELDGILIPIYTWELDGETEIDKEEMLRVLELEISKLEEEKNDKRMVSDCESCGKTDSINTMSGLCPSCHEEMLQQEQEQETQFERFRGN